MARQRKPEPEQEPVGIVISRGRHAEQPPRFAAYVWGPAPEPDVQANEKMVAA